MHDKKDYEQNVYKIPDNFIDESRAFRGMFRTKYLVEAIILSLPFLLLSLLIHADTTSTRITISTIFVSAPFAIGVSGIQGDSVFTFLKNFFAWRKKEGIYFYNYESRSLINTQTDNMINEEDIRTKVGAFLENRRKIKEKEREDAYRESDEFEFYTDKHLEGNYLDEYEEENEEETEAEEMETVSLNEADNESYNNEEVNSVEGCELMDIEDLADAFDADIRNGNIVLAKSLSEDEKRIAKAKESDEERFMTEDEGQYNNLFNTYDWESEVF